MSKIVSVQRGHEAGRDARQCLESLVLVLHAKQHIERFVIEHYVPRERKKRKRKNWSEAPRG